MHGGRPDNLRRWASNSHTICLMCNRPIMVSASCGSLAQKSTPNISNVVEGTSTHDMLPLWSTILNCFSILAGSTSMTTESDVEYPCSVHDGIIKQRYSRRSSFNPLSLRLLSPSSLLSTTSIRGWSPGDDRVEYDCDSGTFCRCLSSRSLARSLFFDLEAPGK